MRRRGQEYYYTRIYIKGTVVGVIATTDVSSNSTHGEVNSIQHYVIKFVGVICTSVIVICWVLSLTILMTLFSDVQKKKDKQQSTKTTQKPPVTRSQQRNKQSKKTKQKKQQHENEPVCTGRVFSSCSTSCTSRETDIVCSRKHHLHGNRFGH